MKITNLMALVVSALVGFLWTLYHIEAYPTQDEAEIVIVFIVSAAFSFGFGKWMRS